MHREIPKAGASLPLIWCATCVDWIEVEPRDHGKCGNCAAVLDRGALLDWQDEIRACAKPSAERPWSTVIDVTQGGLV